MIKVKVKPRSIKIMGHAEFDEYGRDIVCSSVSSIVTTSINAILLFNKGTIKYTVKEGLVSIRILKSEETTKKLLDNMLNMLGELSSQYQDNIKIERE